VNEDCLSLMKLYASDRFYNSGKTTVKTAENLLGAIGDDGQGSKTVTIVDLELGATFEWIAIPRKEERVYMNVSKLFSISYVSR
jgi:hypothetical protein